MTDDAAAEFAAAVLDRLRADAATFAVAESLTGGLVGATFTELPGASRVFRGGVIAYATDLKATLLGVDEAVLAEHGAVHRTVATQLAVGVRDRLAATYGLALTGVAGPHPQDGWPPGTLYVAVAGPVGAARAEVPAMPAHLTRTAARQFATAAALRLLLDEAVRSQKSDRTRPPRNA